MTKTRTPISPIAAAKALTPRWMHNIRDFDALEIHPCIVIGNDGLDQPDRRTMRAGPSAFLVRLRPSSDGRRGRL